MLNINGYISLQYNYFIFRLPKTDRSVWKYLYFLNHEKYSVQPNQNNSVNGNSQYNTLYKCI